MAHSSPWTRTATGSDDESYGDGYAPDYIKPSRQFMFSPNRLAAFPAKESDGQERRRGPGTNGPPGIGPLGPRPPVACRLGTHSRNESVICIMSGPGTVTAPSRGSIEQYSNPHRCIESATIKMDAPSRRYADIGNSSVPSLASTSSERHSAAGRRLAKSKQTRDLQSRNKPATRPAVDPSSILQCCSTRYAPHLRPCFDVLSHTPATAPFRGGMPARGRASRAAGSDGEAAFFGARHR